MGIIKCQNWVQQLHALLVVKQQLQSSRSVAATELATTSLPLLCSDKSNTGGNTSNRSSSKVHGSLGLQR